MSTLWLPTKDPWRWRPLPLRLELPSFRTKEDVIGAMWSFPDCSVLPETEQQQDALTNAKAHFKLMATWLHYRLLGKLHYHDSLHSHPDSLSVKPYADLSVATLDFCYHVYSRMRPEGVDSFEQLWGICEYSKSLAAFRATGYYGDVAPQSKSQLRKNFKHALEAYSQLEQNHSPEQLVTGFDPIEHLTEDLLYQASNFANDPPGDKDLKHHIRMFQRAWRHFSNLTLKPKGFDPVQIKPAKPKRSRGRPPKGSRSRQPSKL